MRIPEIKREELIAKAESSQLRPEAKEEIIAILSQPDISDADMGKVLRAIQEDIERDLEEEPELNALLENDQAFQALVAKQEEELAEVEKSVKESVEFAETQIAELDAADAELKMEEVKGNLGME